VTFAYRLSDWDLWLDELSGADSAWSGGYECGAAAAFGLMGMAEAIRATENARCRERDRANHDCTCPASWGEDYCNCRGGL
jgi:hypothetical protein